MIDRAGAEGGWQTMETAPKDGTRVLLTDGRFLTAGHYAAVPRFNMAARWWTDNPVAFREEDEQGVNYDHFFDEWVREPTHWQPLPAPPTSGDQQ
jgi:hypothetical protein